MHCLYDLGRYTDAVRYADQALDLPSGSVRALALHQILLARVQAGMGEIEQSCETARSALHATVQLRSRRLRDRIGEYSSGLARHVGVGAAQEWTDEARALLVAA